MLSSRILFCTLFISLALGIGWWHLCEWLFNEWAKAQTEHAEGIAILAPMIITITTILASVLTCLLILMLAKWMSKNRLRIRAKRDISGRKERDLGEGKIIEKS